MRKLPLLTFSLIFALTFSLTAIPLFANVIRLAPTVSWYGAGSKLTSLTAVRGQPVVLLIADSPDTKAFRKQVKKLWSLYEQFAARKVVFIAAFKNAHGKIHSNIPFVVAENGARVAAEYQMRRDFNIVVIGKDGNIDYQTSKVCAAQRIKDVIVNSFANQSTERK